MANGIWLPESDYRQSQSDATELTRMPRPVISINSRMLLKLLLDSVAKNSDAGHTASDAFRKGLLAFGSDCASVLIRKQEGWPKTLKPISTIM